MKHAAQTPLVANDVTDEVEEVFEQEQLEAIKKKSVAGAASYLFRSVVLNAIGLVANIALGYYLSLSDFGIYGYVTQFVGLFNFFSDVGLAAALIQKKDEPTLTEYRTAFTIQQILSWLIFGGFIVLAATGYVQETTGPAGTWLLLALGLSFPLASMKVISSLMLERKLDFNKLVVPVIFEQIVYNGVLIIMAYQEAGVHSFTYAILARSVVGPLVMLYIQPWLFGFALDREAMRSMLKFGAKFQLNDLLARMKDQLFFIFLGRYMLTVEQMGMVHWAKNWSMQPYNMTVNNVMAITFPAFSRLQKHPEALARAIDKSIYFITLATFPLLVGMSVFIFPVVAIFEKYQKWQPALLSLVLFSLSIGWSAISSPITSTLNAIGEINTTLKLMLMWLVLTWVLTPLAVWMWGYQGVAIAAFVISFSSIVPIIELKRFVKIHVWENTWQQLLAASVMGGVGAAFIPVWSQNIGMMMLGAMLCSGVYFAVLLGVGRQKLFIEVRELLNKRRK